MTKQISDFLNGGGSLTQQINDNTSRTELINNPNLLINGDFRVWQRGSTFNSVSGTYTADRWSHQNSVGTLTQVAQSLVPITTSGSIPSELGQARTVMQVTTGTGASGYSNLRQVIENGIDLVENNTVTVSFWMYCDGTGVGQTINVLLCDISLGDVTTLLGWNKYTKTFKMPSNMNAERAVYSNGVWFDLRLTFTGVNRVFYFANTKLEIAEAPTKFIPDDEATLTGKCNRYYQKFSVLFIATNSTNLASSWLLPSRMRAAPTLTYSASGQANRVFSNTNGVVSIVVGGFTTNTDSLLLSGTAASLASAYWSTDITLSAEY